jgi:hypothetical protein
MTLVRPSATSSFLLLIPTTSIRLLVPFLALIFHMLVYRCLLLLLALLLLAVDFSLSPFLQPWQFTLLDRSRVEISGTRVKQSRDKHPVRDRDACWVFLVDLEVQDNFQSALEIDVALTGLGQGTATSAFAEVGGLSVERCATWYWINWTRIGLWRAGLRREVAVCWSKWRFRCRRFWSRDIGWTSIASIAGSTALI